MACSSKADTKIYVEEHKEVYASSTRHAAIRRSRSRVARDRVSSKLAPTGREQWLVSTEQLSFSLSALMMYAC